MNWYKFEVTEDQLVSEQSGGMRDEFLKWYESLDTCKETALFSRTCESDPCGTLYVYSESPVHTEILCRMFPAKLCEPPEPDHDRTIPSLTSLLRLLVGDGEAMGVIS
jgi:hypothetical protein